LNKTQIIIEKMR